MTLNNEYAEHLGDFNPDTGEVEPVAWWNPSPDRVPEEADLAVEYFHALGILKPGALIERAENPEQPNCKVWLARSTTHVGAEELLRYPQLQFIARSGVGMEQIDKSTCLQHGVLYHNFHERSAKSVSARVLAGILNYHMGILDNKHVFAISEPNASHPKTRQDLRDATPIRPIKQVLIIGHGRIGAAVASLTHQFFPEARICCYDPDPRISPTCATPVQEENLPQAIGSSDVITLHVPGEAGTVMDRQRLWFMKHEALLINTSRGGAVDQQTLTELVTKNYIVADVDVLQNETRIEPNSQAIAKHTPSTITRHIGGSVLGAEVFNAKQTIQGIVDWVTYGSYNLLDDERDLPFPKVDHRPRETVARIIWTQEKVDVLLGEQLGLLATPILSRSIGRKNCFIYGSHSTASEGEDVEYGILDIPEGQFRDGMDLYRAMHRKLPILKSRIALLVKPSPEEQTDVIWARFLEAMVGVSQRKHKQRKTSRG